MQSNKPNPTKKTTPSFTRINDPREETKREPAKGPAKKVSEKMTPTSTLNNLLDLDDDRQVTAPIVIHDEV